MPKIYIVVRSDGNSSDPWWPAFYVGSKEEAEQAAEQEAENELKAADSLATKPAGESARDYCDRILEISWEYYEVPRRQGK